MNGLPRLLVLAGLALVAAGLVLMLFPRLGIGKLPGDFVFRRGNVTCMFPLMTSLLLSVLLTLVLWLFRR